MYLIDINVYANGTKTNALFTIIDSSYSIVTNALRSASLTLCCALIVCNGTSCTILCSVRTTRTDPNRYLYGARTPHVVTQTRHVHM